MKSAKKKKKKKKKKIGVDRGIGRYYGTIRSQYAHRDEKITERCKLRKKGGRE